MRLLTLLQKEHFMKISEFMVMSVKGQGQGQLSGQPLRWEMFISNFNLVYCRILVRMMSIYEPRHVISNIVVF